MVLVIGGTIFPKKVVHKGTCRSPNDITVNQIDHVARTYLLDVRASRGADIGQTEHYLVRAKNRVRMVKASYGQPARMYDSKRLEHVEIREEFKTTVEQKCQSLDSDDAETLWSLWKDAIKDTACLIAAKKK